MNAWQKAFDDPDHVARYAEGPPRFVPGFHDIHKMTAILLAERAAADANILVLGAGGGLELRALAEAEPGWRFCGVDPAGEMLKLAARTLGAHAGRADLVEGYIEDAPSGPFDAATCLLTLHFLPPEARLRTLEGIRARLRSGAPFVAVHSSFPQDEAGRRAWLARYAAFAVRSGVDFVQAETMQEAVTANLDLLDPEADEKLMAKAGFTGISAFYAAFTWRGWVAYA